MIKIIENPNLLTQQDMIWSPIYFDNIQKDDLVGYYCLLLHKNRDGYLFGKKYTIILQHKESEYGSGIVNKSCVDRYVLFEKSYSENRDRIGKENRDFFDINNYGCFIYAYKSLNMAKKRAYKQYSTIYMSTKSFLV